MDRRGQFGGLCGCELPDSRKTVCPHLALNSIQFGENRPKVISGILRARQNIRQRRHIRRQSNAEQFLKLVLKLTPPPRVRFSSTVPEPSQVAVINSNPRLHGNRGHSASTVLEHSCKQFAGSNTESGESVSGATDTGGQNKRVKQDDGSHINQKALHKYVMDSI
jgi:hypothetical protein